MMKAADFARVDFDKGGGLVPAVVQDASTQQVLMLAYLDRAALEETLESGEATFFSRSRRRRWRKGETSGNRMRVQNVHVDCDGDTLLVSVQPSGPACHLGWTTCFGEDAPLARLAALEQKIAERAGASPEASYTARLLRDGVRRVAQKVGEEGVECALAGAGGSDTELCEESADLLYHLTLLLYARGLSLADVYEVLARRAAEKP